MRIALLLLLGLHGTIHLFGFLKAFHMAEFNALSQPISKIYGIVWLAAFMLFAITAFLFFFESNYWWVGGFLALSTSQFLIYNVWADAKFGTLANLLILVAVVIGYANLSFKNKIVEERKELFQNAGPVSHQQINEEAISKLPLVVQKWLFASGALTHSPVSNVHLVQAVQLKLRPEQENWNDGKAEQYFTLNPPAFNWSIDTTVKSLFSVVGRDKFVNGKGAMTIKLVSLVAVADAKNSDKIDGATLQRYLAEIVWFPSAALSSYITWEPLSENSAKATMEVNGTKGWGEFHFDEQGNFIKFRTLRYQDPKATEPTEWIVIATKTEERNGLRIPVECEASWALESGKWTWLKLKITDIAYNVNEMPVAENKANK